MRRWWQLWWKWLVYGTAIATIAITCFWKLAPAFVLSGRTDVAMQRKLSWLIRLPGPLFVDSGGGSPAYARSMAEQIGAHNKDLYILDDCSSACAEFFIPAARKIYASKKAIIGYHVSEFWLTDFEPNPTKQSDICGYDNLVWLRQRYSERHLNQAFSKQVIARLGTQRVGGRESYAHSGCQQPFYTSLRATIWYPTSRQLKEQLGLDIGHPICADEIKCSQAIVDNTPFARPRVRGEAIIIGDAFYPMKQRSER